MVPQIPSDVLGVIPDILAADLDDGDPADFMSTFGPCSLTCKHFALLCRNHIFADIQHSLGDCKLESEEISFKFARLLSDSPHIIDLIHIIVLRVYLIYELAERSRVTLIDALMKLTSLHSLRMASAFQDLHPMMRLVLEHLLRHSTLTELFVTRMYGLPVSYLANCSNLTHLTLEDTEIFYDWDVLPSTFVLSKPLQLEEFSCAIHLPRSGPTNAGQRGPPLS